MSKVSSLGSNVGSIGKTVIILKFASDLVENHVEDLRRFLRGLFILIIFFRFLSFIENIYNVT